MNVLFVFATEIYEDVNDQITMKILLIVTLTFAGFEIQDNLAFQSPYQIQDCWDGNKCQLDSHCGKLGVCNSPNPWIWPPPIGLSCTYHYKLLITPKLI